MPRRVSLPGAEELFGPVTPERTPSAARDEDESGSHLQAVDEPATIGSGRVKHDEKMTVYVTADELMALERARLELRAALGRSVDRGRLVRAAVALALADLDAHGVDSAVARRLDES